MVPGTRRPSVTQRLTAEGRRLLAGMWVWWNGQQQDMVGSSRAPDGTRTRLPARRQQIMPAFTDMILRVSPIIGDRDRTPP